MSSTDWAQQIADFYQGDSGAFDAIFAYWFPRLASHARMLGIDAADAEDLAAETMYKVARTMHDGSRYDPAEKVAFSTWIYKIGHNIRIDYFRRRSRQPQIETDKPQPGEEGRRIETVPGTRDDPFQASLRSRLRDDFQDCLERIEQACRTALVLHKLEGFGLEEIVAMVGGSVATIHRRVAAAIASLSECLGNKGYDREAIE